MKSAIMTPTTIEPRKTTKNLPIIWTQCCAVNMLSLLREAVARGVGQRFRVQAGLDTLTNLRAAELAQKSWAREGAHL